MFGAKANESLQVLVAATAADGSSEQAGEAAVLVLSDSEEEEKKPAESVLALSDKARNIINCRVQSNPAFNLYYRSKQAI